MAINSVSLIIRGHEFQEIHQISLLDVITLTGNLRIEPGHQPGYLILQEKSPITWLSSTGTSSTRSYTRALIVIARNTITLFVDKV